MKDTRFTEQWDHTSCLLAMAYNAARGKKNKRLTYKDFHPVHATKKKSQPGVKLHDFKDILLGKKKSKRRRK